MIDFPEDLILFLDTLTRDEWNNFCATIGIFKDVEAISFVSFKYPGNYVFYNSKINVIKAIIKYRNLINFK